MKDKRRLPRARTRPSRIRTHEPNLIVLAGPNGAGKSTAAPWLLKGLMEIEDFVNADVIASGLSGFAPEAVALEAGAIMLERLRSLAEARRSFAFETTLASRSYAPWIRQLMASGYRAALIFLWLPTPELAVERVAQRVRLGGHAVPEDTIRRRYQAGLRNFFRLYRPLVNEWRFYDNSMEGTPRLVAASEQGHQTEIADERSWMWIQETWQ